MFNVIDSVLTMKMDVYKQVDYQDPNTGALKREWQYDRSMACHAKGVISNSARSSGLLRLTFIKWRY